MKIENFVYYNSISAYYSLICAEKLLPSNSTFKNMQCNSGTLRAQSYTSELWLKVNWLVHDLAL